MNASIEHCDDVALIAPVLRVLRDAPDQDTFAARLAQALHHGVRFVIAQRGQNVLGCLGYRIVHDVYWGKTLFIDDLVVRPEARGQGIGAALVEFARRQAEALGCDHIRLCSGLSRADAHRFYATNGFERASVQFIQPVHKGEN